MYSKVNKTLPRVLTEEGFRF